LQEKIVKKQNEEKNYKKNLYEKEQEINLLRGFITSLKNKKKNNYYNNNVNNVSINKNNRKDYNNNNDYANSNVLLPAINNSYANLKKNEMENIPSYSNIMNNNVLKEEDDENLKKINNLMKKILDE